MRNANNLWFEIASDRTIIAFLILLFEGWGVWEGWGVLILLFVAGRWGVSYLIIILNIF